MLPIGGYLIPDSKLTASQFVDWIRLTQGLGPLENRGRKPNKPAEPDETVEDYCAKTAQDFDK